MYYINNLEEEQKAIVDPVEVPEHWPSQGKIEFSNVFAQYPSSPEPVLKGMNVNIRKDIILKLNLVVEQEKIGIVGRTGAGKSTITLVLLRLLEPTGSLTIGKLYIISNFIRWN